MASKMFYTAEEAAEKLGKTVSQVLDMGKRGEIQEFRDRDKVMFKAEQINLLREDAKELIGEYTQYAANDPLVKQLDGDTPLGLKLSITTTMAKGTMVQAISTATLSWKLAAWWPTDLRCLRIE